ncbi:MAG: metal-dependent hydrolase [Rhodothermales bacterium]|nr:metal-dependent hydrolase [Rhodothermales bacterium]
MELTFFGHSTLMLKTGSTRILVDPFITDNPAAEGVVAMTDLDPDFILVTHAHGDHFGDTVDIALATGAQVVANFEITSYLTRAAGYDNVLSMNSGGSVLFSFGTLTMTYARHSSSFEDGSYGGNPNGFVLQAEGRTVYIAGDTAPFNEMSWLGEEFNLDLAVLPIGDRYTMGIKGSVRALKMLKPKIVVPVHYNSFPELKTDVDEWVTAVKGTDCRPQVMDPGETITF